MNHPKFVIVVGASAGGMNALSDFAGQLKTGMDAAVFVVVHLSKTSISDFLMRHLQPFRSLQRKVSAQEALIKKDHKYISSPNHYLFRKKTAYFRPTGRKKTGGGH